MELTMSSNDMNTLLTNILSQVSEMRSEIRSVNNKQDIQNDKLTEITIQTQKTNGRVTSLEGRAKILEKTKGKKVSFDPKLLYLLAIGGVIALIIIATRMGIDLKGIGL